MSTNIETLKNIIMVALTAGSHIVTEQELLEKAKTIRASMNSTYPVSDGDFDIILRKIQEQIPIRMDVGVCLVDRRDNYAPWYRNRLGEITPTFWSRFRQYLLVEKAWNKAVVNTIDTVSDDLVELLGDPKSDAPFSRKGLVLGDVQSGKTVNFTAVCNKAVDSGYRIIILLSGTIETLRKQTQHRVDLEFAGIDSYNQFRKQNQSELPGVSRFGKGPVVAFTTNRSDFSAHALDVNNMSLHTVDTRVPIFFVVKKNVRILRNLLDWLKNPQNIGANDRIDLPMLLIDDEADNAGVNVNNDPDEDPTQTNARIRELLKLFNKVSYVAVTATPFANIFINPDTDSEMYEDDLFPRDFIYVLSPPTSTQSIRDYSAYIGASQVFGETSFSSMIVPLEDIEPILPKKHKKEFPFSELPLSLEEAIAYFCLANEIRDIRGDNTTHRSMLIHISHFKNLHEKIEVKVSEFFNAIKYAVQNYAQLDLKQAMNIPEIKFLNSVWEKYHLSEVSSVGWDFFLKGLYPSIAPICIQIVNSNGGALDYDGNKEHGLRVIAIGGNCLSRGLTLEGLMVSYFRRNTMMYDTLLQMGRWFGFRPGYADLCKIWMSTEAKEWFQQITESYVELKNEIRVMREQGLTPKDFGLKVRMHPGALIPTARNKMRTAQVLTRPVNIAGRLLETPRLRSASLQHTEKTMRSFVNKLDSIGLRDSSKSVYFWKGVDSNAIADFLRNFPTDPWNLMFRGADIAEYIDKNPACWDVAIMEGKGSVYKFNDSIEIKTEGRVVQEENGILKISGKSVRVGAGGAGKVGLSPKQIEYIEKKYALAKANDPTMGDEVPDNWYFKIQRPPILMLHVIEKKGHPGNFVFAIGTGFPGGENNTVYVTYTVNLVEWRQYYEENVGIQDTTPGEVQ